MQYLTALGIPKHPSRFYWLTNFGWLLISGWVEVFKPPYPSEKTLSLTNYGNFGKIRKNSKR